MASHTENSRTNRASLPTRSVPALVLIPTGDSSVSVECLNCPASLVVAGVPRDRMIRLMRSWDGEHECSGKF